MSFSGTVRELKNRITFDVNKGSVANYKSAFSGMKADASSIIKKAGAIGIALTVAGQKFYMDQEKSKASISFYAKTNQDAAELLSTINRLRGKTEIISERDLSKALDLFGQMNVKAKDFGKLFPLFQDINIANPKLGGLSGIMDTFKGFVEGGDLDALRKFGSVGKDMAEALSLSNFDASQTVKGQQNRFDMLFNLLEQNKQRFSKLANEQRDTTTFAFSGLTKELSDFTLNFGKSTKPVKGLVEAVRDYIKELNNSGPLWKNIENASEFVSDLGKFIFGDLSFMEMRKHQRSLSGIDDEADQEKLNSPYDSSGPGIVDTIIGGLKYGIGIKEGGLFEDKKENKINLSGNITVEGKNMGGFDPRSLQEQINSTVKEMAIDPIKESLKYISASNGRPVSPGGGM